ncbi:MAG: hypothetical protein RXP97_00285 [Nitrososphaeria archaeon]
MISPAMAVEDVREAEPTGKGMITRPAGHGPHPDLNGVLDVSRMDPGNGATAAGTTQPHLVCHNGIALVKGV